MRRRPVASLSLCANLVLSTQALVVTFYPAAKASLAQ